MGVVVKYHTDDTKFLFGGKTLIFRGFLNIFPNSESPTPPSNILIGVGEKCLWRKQWEVIGLMYMYIVHTPPSAHNQKRGVTENHSTHGRPCILSQWPSH